LLILVVMTLTTRITLVTLVTLIMLVALVTLVSSRSSEITLVSQPGGGATAATLPPKDCCLGEVMRVIRVIRVTS
jgi:hypothetical protein